MPQRKCIFRCKEKLTLFSFPNEGSIRKKGTELLFPGQQREKSTIVATVIEIVAVAFIVIWKIYVLE